MACCRGFLSKSRSIVVVAQLLLSGVGFVWRQGLVSQAGLVLWSSCFHFPSAELAGMQRRALLSWWPAFQAAAPPLRGTAADLLVCLVDPTGTVLPCPTV